MRHYFLNGTLDLRSFQLTPHHPENFITKLVRYNYDQHAACPAFLAFIARIMGNHPEASEPELDRAERMVGYLPFRLPEGHSLSVVGPADDSAIPCPWSFSSRARSLASDWEP